MQQMLKLGLLCCVMCWGCKMGSGGSWTIIVVIQHRVRHCGQPGAPKFMTPPVITARDPRRRRRQRSHPQAWHGRGVAAGSIACAPESTEHLCREGRSGVRSACPCAAVTVAGGRGGGGSGKGGSPAPGSMAARAAGATTLSRKAAAAGHPPPILPRAPPQNYSPRPRCELAGHRSMLCSTTLRTRPQPHALLHHGLANTAAAPCSARPPLRTRPLLHALLDHGVANTAAVHCSRRGDASACF
jgi:hypothetical protein